MIAKVDPKMSISLFITLFQPAIGLCIIVTIGISSIDSTSVFKVRKVPRSGTIFTSTHCSDNNSFNLGKYFWEVPVKAI